MKRVPAPAIAAMAACLAAPAWAVDLSLLHTWDGPTANGQFSIACVVVGDMDGDGFAEYAIGASADPTAGDGAGRVFIYRGGPQNLGQGPAWVIDGQPGDLLGSALAAAGDVDGDGLADLLIGAPGSLGVNPSATGRVLLVYGSRPLGQRAPVVIAGPVARGHFGAALAGLGAFNGDALSDFAIGAPDANAGAGLVEVFFGGRAPPAAPALTLHGRASGDAFGSAVAGAGRFQGGAYTALAVGAPFRSVLHVWAGEVSLFRGGAPPDTTPMRTWEGSAAGDFFGTSIAGAGDVNGDGFDDVVAGAPGANDGALIDAGRAYVFLGASTPPAAAASSYAGRKASDQLGQSVAGIGDVDADGFADFAFGGPGNADSTAVGEIHVVLGRASLPAAPDTVLVGETAGDMFGRSLSNGGLIDAGQHALFLAGSDLHGAGGRAYLYGSSSATLAVGPAITGGGVRLARAWPNPAWEDVSIVLDSGTDASVSLDVLDVDGRAIAHLFDGPIGAGSHAFRWDARRTRPGLYWISLSSGGSRRSRPVVIRGR